MSTPDPRKILGAFIRAHRERLSPPAQAGGRRRTPGLRREELAEAAGVGVTWITWLEQGRDVSASSASLARLAAALHLNPAERASLFDLAGKRDPLAAPDPQDQLPSHFSILPSLFSAPAYLLDHAWTARAWNAAAARLFVGWLDQQGTSLNLLHFVFLSPIAKTLMVNWPERARRVVAEFRADYNRRPRDPAMQELVEYLSENSPVFRGLWQEHLVLHREGGEREYNHPADGRQLFIHTTLLVASHPEYKLICLAPLKEVSDKGHNGYNTRG